MNNPFIPPVPKDFGEFLTALVGRDVRATRAAAATVPPVLFAAYRSQESVLVGIAALDLELAASLGAALAMVPQPQVAAAVKSKAMTENLRENVHEVLNVTSRYFQAIVPGMVQMAEVKYPGQPSTELQNALRTISPARSRRYDATVQGYGKGFIVLASPIT